MEKEGSAGSHKGLAALYHDAKASKARKSFIGRKSIFDRSATGAARSPAATAKPESKRIACRTEPKDVVDGHQDRTLSLLWSMMEASYIPGRIKFASIQQEIKHVASGHPSAAAILTATGNDSTLSPEDLLFQWLQVVCALAGMRIQDWSASTADGR